MKKLLILLVISLLACVTGCSTKESNTAIKTTNNSESNAILSSSSISNGYRSSSGDNASDCFNISEITSEIKKAGKSYQDIYKKVNNKQYFNVYATDEQRQEIVNRIGMLGYAVESNGIDMKNSRLVQSFWNRIKAGSNAQIGIYEVETDASLNRYCFNYSNGKMMFICGTVSWSQSNQPQIQYDQVRTVDKFELTSKGYFLYHTPAQNGLWENSNGFRVTPLPAENRELCKKYIEPVGYQGNNIFTSSWNQQTITKLNFNDMFEYIYRLEYQKEPDNSKYAYYYPDKVNTLAVRAENFESIITKYFPVSAKKLRETAIFDPSRRVYVWQPFCGPQYEPTPEVVSYRTNKDGSLTLSVDAVAIEYYSDCDFTDTVTVMPQKDGSFKYLSNSLKIIHPEQFPTYSPRIVQNK